MGQQSTRDTFKVIGFEDYQKLLDGNAEPMALISYDNQYIHMNEAHAKFFGYQDFEDAMIHMGLKGPANYSPEKQENGKLSSEAVKENAISTIRSKTGVYSFNWMHQTKTGVFKKCTIVLTECRYQSCYAFQVLVLPYGTYDNPMEKFSKIVSAQYSIFDTTMSRSTCQFKPQFTGEDMTLFGSFFKKPTKRYLWLDCTGRNLFFYKKKGDKEPEGTIKIDHQTIIRSTENPKSIELTGPYRTLFRIEGKTGKQISDLKELLEKSQISQNEQRTKPLKELVDDLIHHLEIGKLLKAFETYYDDRVVMSENLNTSKRVGIHQNRIYEQGFMSMVQWKGSKPRVAGRVAIEGSYSAIEWYFHFEIPEYNLHVERTQIAIAEWKDGKMTREDFYYTNLHLTEFPPLPELVEQAKTCKHTTEETRVLAQKIIDGFSQGKIVDTFKDNYHKDIVMTENGKARVGYDANFKYEDTFMKHVKWVRKPYIKRVIVEGPLAVVEWEFEFNAFGNHVNRQQIAVELWKDGKCLREDFYYDTPKPKEE